MHRQVRAESIARKYRTGILLFEAGPFGTIADDDFASRPVHLQEGVDVLLDGDAADVGCDRTRQRQEFFRPRLEQSGIDPAVPGREIAEAPGLEVAAHRGGAHHASRGRSMEPAQSPVGESQGNRKARAQILRKLSVI